MSARILPNLHNLVFVSLNREFIRLASETFPDATVCDKNVNTIETRGTAFVSPANSFGFMDGGIDAAYRRMFPECEETVKRAIAGIGRHTNRGRPYLRVGSVLWQHVKSGGTYLITAPTMFLPHDVSRTQNAYWAMRAALLAFDRIQFMSPQTTRLVVPSLCCGWGGMRPAVSISQIRRALRDHALGAVPLTMEVQGMYYLLLPSRDHEQPSNCDNREIGVPWPATEPPEEKSVWITK